MCYVLMFLYTMNNHIYIRKYYFLVFLIWFANLVARLPARFYYPGDERDSDWLTLESGKFKRRLPIFKRGGEIVLNIIQTISDKYFETHPPETVTFRFPYNIRYGY